MPLSVVVVRVPEYTRRVAHHLFLYAEAEKGNSFFGLLSNGDYVICMPGSGYTEGAMKRTALNRALAGFDVTSGLAVLDQEQTASELVAVAVRDCGFTGRDRFSGAVSLPHCHNSISLRRLRDH